METPAQRCVRIVAALEDLAAQEAASIAAGDYPGALAVQDRAEPLVDFLANDASVPRNDTQLRKRVASICTRRQSTGEKLGAEMTQVRAELQQMQAAQSRVAKIAPVYGSEKPAIRRWQAIG